MIDSGFGWRPIRGEDSVWQGLTTAQGDDSGLALGGQVGPHNAKGKAQNAPSWIIYALPKACLAFDKVSPRALIGVQATVCAFLRC